jgi:hypothetical protein
LIRLLVAGSRDAFTWEEVERELDAWVITHGRPDEIIHGAARGVDTFASVYAVRHGIPQRDFPVTRADWRLHGIDAAFWRNEVMAKEATHALIIHVETGGSLDMLARARAHGLDVTEINAIPF